MAVVLGLPFDSAFSSVTGTAQMQAMRKSLFAQADAIRLEMVRVIKATKIDRTLMSALIQPLPSGAVRGRWRLHTAAAVSKNQWIDFEDAGQYLDLMAPAHRDRFVKLNRRIRELSALSIAVFSCIRRIEEFLEIKHERFRK